jgi:hypothetical protein
MRISLTGLRTLRPHAKHLSIFQLFWPATATVRSGQNRSPSRSGSLPIVVDPKEIQNGRASALFK